MGSSRITGAPNNTIFTRYIHSFKESEKNCEKIPTMGFPSFFLLLHVLIATITDARVLSEGTSTSTLTPGFSSSPLTAMSTPMPSGTSTLLSTSPSARISLYPVNASLSSSYYGGYYPATKCIDGITNDGDWGPGNDGMCHTMRDLFLGLLLTSAAWSWSSELRLSTDLSLVLAPGTSTSSLEINFQVPCLVSLMVLVQMGRPSPLQVMRCWPGDM